MNTTTRNRAHDALMVLCILLLIVGAALVWTAALSMAMTPAVGPVVVGPSTVIGA